MALLETRSTLRASRFSSSSARSPNLSPMDGATSTRMSMSLFSRCSPLAKEPKTARRCTPKRSASSGLASRSSWMISSRLFTVFLWGLIRTTGCGRFSKQFPGAPSAASVTCGQGLISCPCSRGSGSFCRGAGAAGRPWARSRCAESGQAFCPSAVALEA